MTKVKFCGLSRVEDIAAVNRLLPEFVGFVFAERSRRHITASRAAVLKKHLDSRIKAVGVFVDESMERIADIARADIIDVAQLHGHEGEGYITELKRRIKKPIIKAVVPKGEENIADIEKTEADYILYDAGQGEGKTFPWELLKNAERPYLLAGGLTAENVKAAISRLHPFAVDVSSGIETNGFKDVEKMAAFLAAVREKGE